MSHSADLFLDNLFSQRFSFERFNARGNAHISRYRGLQLISSFSNLFFISTLIKTNFSEEWISSYEIEFWSQEVSDIITLIYGIDEYLKHLLTSFNEMLPETSII